MNSTINQVRQVLMNELGLSRESIRKEVERVVADTVERHINRLIDEGRLQKITEEILVTRGYRSGVESVAGRVAEQFIQEAIRLRCKAELGEKDES